MTHRMRRDLVACRHPSVDAGSVQHKEKVGKPIGAVDRCNHRYVVYMEGKSASSGLLPMLGAGAVMFLPEPQQYFAVHDR